MAVKAPKVDSKEHELEILGMGLADEPTAKLVTTIPSSLFYYSRHRAVHKTMKMLVEQNQAIDNLALVAKLGNEYAPVIAEITLHGINTSKFKQRVNELRDIRFRHQINNISEDTTIEELEELIQKYKPDQEEDRSYIPDKKGLLTKIHSYKKTGGTEAFSTGYETLDQHYRVARGSLSVVTGIPGHGKSTWLDNVAVRMAVAHGWHICMFSPESYPIEQHYARLIEIHSEYTMLSKKHLTTVPRISNEKLEQSFNFVYDHIKALYIPPEERTLDGIMSQVTNEYDGFVLDPWNEIEHRRDPGLNETEYIGETLMRLKAYAVFRNMHVWLVAHPRKLTKDDSGDYSAPEPYDISGSANWYNKADMCVTVHRPKDDDPGIYVKKVRVRGTGKRGEVHFKFNQDNQRFYEKENEVPF